jgi:hypothetical protein
MFNALLTLNTDKSTLTVSLISLDMGRKNKLKDVRLSQAQNTEEKKRREREDEEEKEEEKKEEEEEEEEEEKEEEEEEEEEKW